MAKPHPPILYSESRDCAAIGAEELTAQIDFGEELEESPATEYELTDVIGIDPELDLALFRVERAFSQAAPCRRP